MNKELNMFNRKKNKLFKISTLKNKLTDVQTTLIAFDFELMEIWTPDEGDEKQVWFNQSKFWSGGLLPLRTRHSSVGGRGEGCRPPTCQHHPNTPPGVSTFTQNH